ncbi:MAG: YHS domain-containing (seleno)protein [Acidobacteriota bacterium]
MPSRRSHLAAAALVFAAAAVAISVAAVPPVNTGTFNNVAIKGYDPVAYFTEGEPAKGSKRIIHNWAGAEWRFASEKNRALFAAEPEAYAPQYGGYCAWAVAQGSTAGIDPKSWKIVDGKLYLNYNGKIQKRWEGDIPGHIEAADANWPGLVD